MTALSRHGKAGNRCCCVPAHLMLMSSILVYMAVAVAVAAKYCVTKDGQRLSPDETAYVSSDVPGGPCDVCRCYITGDLMCHKQSCVTPMCVGPYVTLGEECCWRCPLGNNCLLPTGAVIYAGEKVEHDGKTCFCPQQAGKNMSGIRQRQHYTAVCVEHLSGFKFVDKSDG